ncbi:hypothetical protein M422DRAFT_25066 [Sphaerobolus stellatus SS14]|nr:hypothetical protein M422DRAFT_25066 [Sphaerobolus stellatus SS14]
MSLPTLPPELYHAILSHIPPQNLQHTTLSLTRALPTSPVPQRPLFEHIAITRYEQLHRLYSRLQRRHWDASGADGPMQREGDERRWVKTFNLIAWNIDPEVLINVLGLLENLEELSLWIGSGFTPEQVQEALEVVRDFHEEMGRLRVLNLRFRPYVKTARYYQFLKGSYYEPFLDTLSSWPVSTSHPNPLTSLSILQDPLPSQPAMSPLSKRPFAQPIVFFSLTPFTTLALSPFARHISHLRLRVPQRSLVHSLLSPSHSNSSQSPIGPKHFPNVTFLDLSTTHIREADLPSLIYVIGGGKTRDYVLDGTGVCGATMNRVDVAGAGASEWESLGRSIASAGVGYARGREKGVKALLEAWTRGRGRGADGGAEEGGEGEGRDGLGGLGMGMGAAETRRGRRGRRGLAISTISLRDRPSTSGSGSSTPLLSPPSSLPASLAPSATTQSAKKIRILPPPPNIRTLCVAFPNAMLKPRRQTVRTREKLVALEAQAREEFARGWVDGVRLIRVVWERLRGSARSGSVRVFGVDLNKSQGENSKGKGKGAANGEEDGEEDGEGVMEGLSELTEAQIEDGMKALEGLEVPLLCFRGAVGSADGEDEGDGYIGEEREREDVEGDADGGLEVEEETEVGGVDRAARKEVLGEDGEGVDRWEGHPEGCGHRRGWEIWGDGL